LAILDNDWEKYLGEEFEKEYYLKLREFLKAEYSTKTIYPPMHDIFNALKYTSFENVRVVILGQDPYINVGQAHGLSFSVLTGASTPKSLQNIYKEIVSDVGGYVPNNGYLKKWTEQGVLLLNTVLTVEEKKSKSHARKGWETFTDKVIEVLNEKETPLVYLLWGNDAKNKAALITNKNHKILTAVHPSPLAGGGFFGCKHFSQTNEFLKKHYGQEIDWQIENV